MSKLKPAILGGKPVFRNLLPFTRPTIPEISKLLSKYREAFKSGMITNAGKVSEFEKKAAKHLGAKHAVALNSCTSGLMLILKALGLKGEVIIPSFTFYATGHSVLWNNLTPVLVDCDPETYCIDPKEIEKAITSKTSAILGVHVFGNPSDIEALEKIAKKHKLKLIFDAAHGFGVKYKHGYLGKWADAQSFSLSPTKLLTSAEGGIVSTNDDELARSIMIGRNYGDPGTYDPEFIGLSSRMSELHAILGIESLNDLEKNTRRRNKMVVLYKKLLKKLPGIIQQTIKPGNRSSFKDFSIYIDRSQFGLSRDQLYKALELENIMVKKYFYPPLHQQRVFKQFVRIKLKLINSQDLADNSISLPLFSHIPEETVQKVVQAIYRVYEYREEISKRF